MENMREEDKINVVIDKLKDKKAFAREQYDFLKNNGIQGRMRLSRIFKAAGPGQVKEAWKLATCVDESGDEDAVQSDKDLLACVLTGSSRVRIGRKRMEDVLSSNGFYVPEAHSDFCFFRVLDGAAEIVVPGSYHFTREGLAEIKDGLKKKIYEDNEEDIQSQGD